ncbi:trichothecene 3-o-acetyltransferase [Colletotrichum sojae]|uniref:Trichothecene 3-o-acetyltransferase n=1 Tax=Colletotrichum sojae TaxID=2175907 RepID=A0A8H6J206_9PEZI|nr:trichothecene 3-o-acetyltransferase [Colletotrichum sojae]
MASSKFPGGSVEMMEYPQTNRSTFGNLPLPSEDHLSARKPVGHPRNVMDEWRKTAKNFMADCCGLGTSEPPEEVDVVETPGKRAVVQATTVQETPTQSVCAAPVADYQGAWSTPEWISKWGKTELKMSNRSFSPTELRFPPRTYNRNCKEVKAFSSSSGHSSSPPAEIPRGQRDNAPTTKDTRSYDQHYEEPRTFSPSPEQSLSCYGEISRERADATPLEPHLALLPLSPLDQIAPRTYIRLVYIFTWKEGQYRGICPAISHLKERFRIALTRWPFLAGQIRPAREGHNRIELVYPRDNSGLDLSDRPDLFAHELVPYIGGKQHWDHTASKFLAWDMEQHVLSLSPEDPKAGESCPPVTLKICEQGSKRYGRGGLFVCFSAHHGIFDNTFLQTFIEFFANGKLGETSFHQDMIQRPSMDPHTRTDISSYKFDEYDFSDVVVPPPRNFQPGGEVFKIVDDHLRRIYAHTKRQLVARYGGDGVDVFKMDVLSAMFWFYVTRARFYHLSPGDETAFTIDICGRRSLDPKFPRTAWGNVGARTVARTTVADLVRPLPNGKLPTNPKKVQEAITNATLLIRRALDRELLERDLVPARIALASGLRDPAAEAEEALRRAIRPDNSGLHCNVWMDLGADLDFGIPGTSGTPDWIRETFSRSPKEGTMNIMPRHDRGGADWEISLALRAADLKRFNKKIRYGFPDLFAY